jgi:hypothetical protein
LRAAGVCRRVGEGGVAYPAAVAAPVRGIPNPHQNFVERDHRGELGFGQDRREVLGDEGNLGIGFGRVGVVGVVRGCGGGGADIAQHALGVKGWNLGAEIAGRHRQIAGDADERPYPHDVTVADPGDGRNPHHVARRGRFARWRQAIALVQAGFGVVGAERSPQRAFDPFRYLGKRHFAVERRKNGAADQSCAAQAGQDGAAKPLYRDAAAIDHRGFGAIDGKRRLVTKIDDPGLAPVAAPA